MWVGVDKELIGDGGGFYSLDIQFMPIFCMMLLLTVWIFQFQIFFLRVKWKYVFSGMHFIVASLPLQSRKVCNEKHPRLQVHIQVMCRLNNTLSKKTAFYFFSLFSEIRIVLLWAVPVVRVSSGGDLSFYLGMCSSISQ